jgi:hypothetical protein
LALVACTHSVSDPHPSVSSPAASIATPSSSPASSPSPAAERVTFDTLQSAVIAAGFPGCAGSSTRSHYHADILSCATPGKHTLLYLVAADHSRPLQNTLVAFVYACKIGTRDMRPGAYWVITDKASFIVFSSSERWAGTLATALAPFGGRPGTIC